MQFLFRGRSYWGGFCFPPDRTVCGPPPLEANLFAFCKRSLSYKMSVWVWPIPYRVYIYILYIYIDIQLGSIYYKYSPYSTSPFIAYSLFPIPPLLPIPYSISPMPPFPTYCLLPIPYSPLPPLLPIPYFLFPIAVLVLSFHKLIA